jgi:hypothetical protein
VFGYIDRMVGCLRHTRWPIAAGLVVALAGCAETTDRITRTGTPATERRADGRLKMDPAPLTVADLNSLPPGSPQRTVARAWFYAQWGSPANVLRCYDDRVLSVVGRKAIAGAYAQQRTTMIDARPEFALGASNANGALVTVLLSSTGDPPRPESYLLRRRGASWRIVYDSFLEPALAAYITSDRQTSDGQDPASAARSGAQAAKRYRELYIAVAGAARLADRVQPARNRAAGLPLPSGTDTIAP